MGLLAKFFCLGSGGKSKRKSKKKNKTKGKGVSSPLHNPVASGNAAMDRAPSIALANPSVPPGGPRHAFPTGGHGPGSVSIPPSRAASTRYHDAGSIRVGSSAGSHLSWDEPLRQNNLQYTRPHSSFEPRARPGTTMMHTMQEMGGEAGHSTGAASSIATSQLPSHAASTRYSAGQTRPHSSIEPRARNRASMPASAGRPTAGESPSKPEVSRSRSTVKKTKLVPIGSETMWVEKRKNGNLYLSRRKK